MLATVTFTEERELHLGKFLASQCVLESGGIHADSWQIGG